MKFMLNQDQYQFLIKKNMFKKKIKTGHIILEKSSCFQVEDEGDFLMAKIFKKIKN